MKWQSLAFVDADGVLHASAAWKSPEDVLKCCLGWPDEQEIEEAKASGCRVVRVTIEEVEK